MPRKKDSGEAAASTPAISALRPKLTKTKVILAAFKANPRKGPKEIAEILQGQGYDMTAAYVSTVKSKAKSKKKPTVAADAPAAPADAISVGLLRKARKLAEELGGIKEAKAAISALAQLLD